MLVEFTVNVLIKNRILQQTKKCFCFGIELAPVSFSISTHLKRETDRVRNDLWRI